MNILGGILTIGGFVACCATLWVLFLVALVIWYWRRQPNQEVSATAPEPPIQATIEHPTVATPVSPAEPVAPAPVEPPAEPPSPSEPTSPSSDA